MSPADINFRKGVPDDAAALSAYINVLADEGGDTIPNTRFSPEEERQFLEKAAKQDRAFFLLACDGPAIVAVLDIWAGERPFNRHAGRLGMSVLSGYRRMGIGRRLLDMAIEETKTWPGFCRIELEAVPWNIPAIRLYESRGFVREGLKQKGAKLRDEPHGVVLMALVW